MDTALVGKYEGETQNGRYHGRGKITYGDSYYEGTFFNGQMHGEGKLTVKSKHSCRHHVNDSILTLLIISVQVVTTKGTGKTVGSLAAVMCSKTDWSTRRSHRRTGTTAQRAILVSTEK
jgi:hypothetical protein